MPKSFDKTKGAKKRKSSPTNTSSNVESDGSESKPRVKKKKVQRRAVLEGIEMSKQLATEMKTKTAIRPRNQSKKSSEPRLLGNGQPMPSLAELEAMYEDSDGEEEAPKQAITTVDQSSTQASEPPVIIDEINLDSPDTLKLITSKVIDIISKKVIDLDDDEKPPPPVIPQKKPKKSDTPYIVGCKSRPQVPWAPKTKFCVGSEDYGIDPNQPDEEDEIKKRKKRGAPINLSKSIFNAKSDEIAERLKELDSPEPQRAGSPDSNKTVEYDFANSPRANMLRCFSPLPSTSRDSETIKKNDKLFNESLTSESVLKEVTINESNSPDDVEIIEIPHETVVIDDLPNLSIKSENIHYPKFESDDCCIIDEPKIKRKRSSESSTKEVCHARDEIYGSIDLTQAYDNEVFIINDDDDIDQLIAESKAILEKDLKKNNIDTVTAVDSSVIVLEQENRISEPTADIISNTSNINNSEVMCHPADVLECVEVETSAPTNINREQPNPTLSSSRNDEIAEVVTNFFNHPQNSDSYSTMIDINRLKSANTMLNRITRWASSIESFLIGLRTSNTPSNNDVVLIDDNNETVRAPDISVPPLQQSTSYQQQVPPQPSTSASTSQSSPPTRSLGDCPICMDSLANCSVASTMCGHVFCMPCIKAAIRANGKKCPTCRKSLKGVGYHQLFI